MANWIDGILGFAFYYPLFMAYLWMVGGSYYYWHWERMDRRAYENPPKLPDYPRVSIIVPCHNEGDNAADTLTALLNQDYPDFEIIAVNDGRYARRWWPYHAPSLSIRVRAPFGSARIAESTPNEGQRHDTHTRDRAA